jgi:hypothetical protein
LQRERRKDDGSTPAPGEARGKEVIEKRIARQRREQLIYEKDEQIAGEYYCN